MPKVTSTELTRSYACTLQKLIDGYESQTLKSHAPLRCAQAVGLHEFPKTLSGSANDCHAVKKKYAGVTRLTIGENDSVRKHLTDSGIIRGYARLNTKINDLHKELRQILTLLTSPVKLTQNEKLILLSLPSHLIKTYFTLESQGSATATQISQFTNKARAIESSYLCQLTTMGYITKRRKSRIVIYSMKMQNCIEKGDTNLEPQPPNT